MQQTQTQTDKQTASALAVTGQTDLEVKSLASPTHSPHVSFSLPQSHDAGPSRVDLQHRRSLSQDSTGSGDFQLDTSAGSRFTGLSIMQGAKEPRHRLKILRGDFSPNEGLAEIKTRQTPEARATVESLKSVFVDVQKLEAKIQVSLLDHNSYLKPDNGNRTLFQPICNLPICEILKSLAFHVKFWGIEFKMQFKQFKVEPASDWMPIFEKVNRLYLTVQEMEAEQHRAKDKALQESFAKMKVGEGKDRAGRRTDWRDRDDDRDRQTQLLSRPSVMTTSVADDRSRFYRQSSQPALQTHREHKDSLTDDSAFSFAHTSASASVPAPYNRVFTAESLAEARKEKTTLIFVNDALKAISIHSIIPVKKSSAHYFISDPTARKVDKKELAEFDWQPSDHGETIPVMFHKGGSENNFQLYHTIPGERYYNGQRVHEILVVQPGDKPKIVQL